MTGIIANRKRDSSLSYFSHKGLTINKLVTPTANIDVSNSEYIITIATPGFTKEKLSVQIKKNKLLVYTTSLQIENNYTHDVCEYDLHKWKRIFRLPHDADALMARAMCTNGELIINIPKGNKNEITFDHPVVIY